MTRTARDIDEHGCITGITLHEKAENDVKKAINEVSRLRGLLLGGWSTISIIGMLLAALLAWIMLDTKAKAMTEISRNAEENKARIEAYRESMTKEVDLKERTTLQRITGIEGIAVENQQSVKQLSYDMIRLTSLLTVQDQRQAEILAIVKDLRQSR